jgi:mitochondrial import receptor subunit TOM40
MTEPKDSPSSASSAPALLQALYPYNPGYYEELNRKVKDVFPAVLDGLKVVLNKGVSSHFQVMHTINIAGAAGASGGPQAGMLVPSYSFGSTFVGSKQMSESEMYPVLLAEMDNNGSLNAQMIHHITERIRGKIIAQTQKSKWAALQTVFDYRGNTYTASLTTVNADLISNNGVMIGHFLKRITPGLCCGSELVIHSGAEGVRANTSLLARYQRSNWELVGSASPASGFTASYFHKASDNVAVGVEWECALAQGESQVSIGYSVDMPDAQGLLKGSIDSTGTVSATYEKKLLPMPLTLILSASMNHLRGVNKFGLGLTLG